MKKVVALRTQLCTERDRIRGCIQQRLLANESNGHLGDIVDVATLTTERARTRAVRHCLECSQVQVDNALRKLELGTYGLCEECRRRIDRARLKALPSATLCLECQRRSETGAQGYPRRVVSAA